MFKEHVSIEIESSNRSSGNVNDFVTHFETIKFNQKKQYFSRIEKVHIPVTYYQFNSTNKSFYIVEDDGITQDDVKVDITEGTYTIDEMITELEAQLDAGTQQANDYTINYSDITMKISISYTGTSTSVTIKSGTSESSLNDALGFLTDGTDQSFSALPSSTTAPNVFMMNQINEINILTNVSSHNHYINHSTKSSRQPLGLTINADQSRGTFIDVDNSDGYKQKLNGQTSINSISVRLLDGDDNLLELNGRQWRFILVIYEYNP